jgi:hypothetical protein
MSSHTCVCVCGLVGEWSGWGGMDSNLGLEIDLHDWMYFAHSLRVMLEHFFKTGHECLQSYYFQFIIHSYTT